MTNQINSEISNINILEGLILYILDCLNSLSLIILDCLNSLSHKILDCLNSLRHNILDYLNSLYTLFYKKYNYMKQRAILLIFLPKFTVINIKKLKSCLQRSSLPASAARAARVVVALCLQPWWSNNCE